MVHGLDIRIDIYIYMIWIDMIIEDHGHIDFPDHIFIYSVVVNMNDSRLMKWS